MPHRSAHRAAAIIAGASLVLCGCYEDLAPAQAEARPTATEPPPADGPVTGQVTGSGGRGALGKSRDAAKNTVGNLEKRQADLEKEIDDQ